MTCCPKTLFKQQRFINLPQQDVVFNQSRQTVIACRPGGFVVLIIRLFILQMMRRSTRSGNG
jgi:hypothetical protein